MTEQARSEVIKILRGLLVSSKDMQSLNQLNADYYSMVGERIPLKKLGFSRLIDFIQSLPGEFSLTMRSQEYFVSAKPSEKSAHIMELVRKQKRSKRNKRKPPPTSNTNKETRGVRRKRTKRFIPAPSSVSKIALRLQVPKSETSERSSQASPDRPVSTPPSKLPTLQGNLPRQIPICEENVPLKSQAISDSLVLTQLSKLRTGQRNSPLNRGVCPENNPSRCQAFSDSLVLTQSSKRGTGQGNSPLDIPVCVENIFSRSQLFSRWPVSIPKDRIGVEEQEDTSRTITDHETVDIFSESSEDSSSAYSTSLSSSAFQSTPSGSKFIRTGNSLCDLKRFAELNNLGDVTINFIGIGKTTMCRIQVGTTYCYNSFPVSFGSITEAQNICCEEVLSMLIKKFGNISPLISTTQEMLERIMPILERNTKGVLAWPLQAFYYHKYNEALPEDWLKIIDLNPRIQIEKLNEDFFIRFSRSSFNEVAPCTSTVRVPKKKIIPGNDSKLIARVCYMNSPKEIWCRQIRTQESRVYLLQMKYLKTFFKKHRSTVDHIVKNGYYVAKCQNEYHRVKALKIYKTDVCCFFIDIGKLSTIAKSDIFKLPEQFAESPAQAFTCRLWNLDDVYEMTSSEHFLSLHNKLVTLEIVEKISDNLSNSLAVIMYDFETGLKMNDDLHDSLILELARPKLNRNGLTLAYVTEIEPNGDLYVQLKNKYYEGLMILQKPIEEILDKSPIKRAYKLKKTSSAEKIFFYKDEVDRRWNRVKIIDWSPAGDCIQIYFVDLGRTDIIKVNEKELVPLEAFENTLKLINYPPQAIRVKMNLCSGLSEFVFMASTIINKEKYVLLKAKGTTEDNLPLVDMYKRTADGSLFCVNTSIQMESALRSKSSNLWSGLLAEADCSSYSVPINFTKIENIEVLVTVVFNPHNFFIQIKESSEELSEMMGILQIRSKNKRPKAVKLEDVVPGKVFVSKYIDDGLWYRIKILKVTSMGVISVFYMDYGYYRTILVEELVPIDYDCLILPAQALKAKLADVLPVQSKWAVSDCEQFKQIAEGRLFLATQIIEKEYAAEDHELTLNLSLFDTNKGLYVIEELVEKNIALSINQKISD